MKLLSLICGLAMLAVSVLSLDVTGPPGAVLPRLEIRQLATQSPMQFTLYILALQQMQATPPSSLQSYFQIAGIHGVPRTSYDGVGQCGNCRGADGYCTHDSILFLAWHRAYLALFEQVLVANAKTIANKYPSGTTRAQYVAAANKLRIPYWDWAARPPSGNNLPIQVTSPKISVNTPTGKKTIANPLYTFTFPSGTTKSLVYPPWTSWPHTLRYPSSNAPGATGNMAKCISAFNNIRGSLQDQLYQIFSTCDTYSEVGLDTVSTGTKKCSNSLEGLHNLVHNTAGGLKHDGIQGGHMTVLSLAAFDPIFWLHHTNVDRLFAMWQAVYPGSYGGSQKATMSTWTIAAGSTQNINSPLTPFHKAGGGFWTTKDVRRTQTFHYTYPEFADSDGSSASISKYINNLYGPNANAVAGSSKRAAIADVITPLVANNGSLFQYVANIQTSRYALGGSYNIYLFNGNPTTEDPNSWILDSKLIGPMGVLADEAMTSSNTVATGSVPLTRSLTDVVGAALTDLTEAMVVPYLVQNLQWRIVDPNGKQIDPKSVPDFDITVYASTATQPSDGQLPVWSDFIALQDITADLSNPPVASSSVASEAPTPSGGASASAPSPLAATDAPLSPLAATVEVTTKVTTTSTTTSSPAASILRRRRNH